MKKSYTVAVAGSIVMATMTIGMGARPQRDSAGNASQAKSATAAGKTVLTRNDVTLKGGFDLPAVQSVNGIAGFTIRYVDGVRYVLFSGSGSRVFRIRDPGTGTDANSYPVASGEAAYGRVGKNAKLPNDSAHSMTLVKNGLYWDEPSQRLYWNFYNGYGGSEADYSFGASSLDETTHATNDLGCWGFNQNQRYSNTGIVPIPSWFTEQYLAPGQRLAAGFGGSQSAFGANVSIGPSLTAFEPDSGMNDCPAKVSYMRGKLLLAFQAPHNLARTSLTSYYDWVGWYPPQAVKGVGTWTEQSILQQGAVWVDTPKRTGFVVFPLMGDGNLNTTVVESPPPTHNTATLTTVMLADGTSLRPGDVVNIQQDERLGQNCNGTETVKILKVEGNTITFATNEDEGRQTKLPRVGGLVRGGNLYCWGTTLSTRGRYRWQVYDPADLGKVAKGSMPPHGPSPASEWGVAYDSPWTGDPAPGWSQGGSLHVGGAAFDPIANQILVEVNFASRAKTGRVYVYDVN